MTNKTFMVAQREYMENVRTKTFWFGVLAAPIGIALFYIAMFLFADKTDVRKYAIYDTSTSEDKALGDQWLSKRIRERAKIDKLLGEIRSTVNAAVERAVPAGDDATADLRTQMLGHKKGTKSAGELIADKLEPVIREKSMFKRGMLLMKMATNEATLAAKKEAATLPKPHKDALARFRKELETEFPALMSRVNEEGNHSEFEEIEFAPSGDNVESNTEQLKKMLNEGKLFAYFVIDKDPLKSGHTSEYVSKNRTDRKLRNWFTNHATEVIRGVHVDKLKQDKNLDDKDLANIRARFKFADKKVTESGKVEAAKKSDIAYQWAPVAFVYLLWLTVFIAATMLLTNTVEEKSNRIIEVLLSSVSPSQLMHGKIYGIALTGLTIVGSWALFLYAGIKLAPTFFPPSQEIIDELKLDVIISDPLYLGSFLAYFLAGYLFYAAILVAIGSVCNSLKEAQNLQQPVMFALFVPLATMIPISSDPNGTLAKVITYIPLYTPFAMMNRASGPPPAWEYAVTTAIILFSVWIAFRGAAKVFRVGVLMTGKPPKFGEIIRWMRAPVK